jgi:hypothetical protein
MRFFQSSILHLAYLHILQRQRTAATLATVELGKLHHPEPAHPKSSSNLLPPSGTDSLPTGSNFKALQHLRPSISSGLILAPCGKLRSDSQGYLAGKSHWAAHVPQGIRQHTGQCMAVSSMRKVWTGPCWRNQWPVPNMWQLLQFEPPSRVAVAAVLMSTGTNIAYAPLHGNWRRSGQELIVSRRILGAIVSLLTAHTTCF